MKKTFILQKVLFISYILAMVACFIFALSFMTDYSNLFELILPANKPIAHWHNVVMQNYNDVIFYISVIGMISIIVVFVCEVYKKVCDKFAVILVNAFSLVTLVTGVYSLFKLPAMKSEYHTLDFSYLELEALSDYVPIDRIFGYGMILYGIVVLIVVGFMAITIVNYFRYKKLEKIGAANE